MSKPEGSEGDLIGLKITALAEVFRDAPNERIKKLLGKTKASESFVVNTKAINTASVGDLKETLTFLRGNGEFPTDSEINEGLVQAGLVRFVLLEVNKLLPYKCGSCTKAVMNNRLENPEVRCRGCGIGACHDCFTSS